MIGTRLGHYRILGRLGAGGMGEVYRAHDEKLDRDVAIKVLPEGALSDPAARARLLREARSGAALNHPYICAFYDVGEVEGRAYIAMELVEGQPLSTLLAAGPLPEDLSRRYATQIAEALGHAHARGMVHRDLKAANVMITPEGQAKVLDFGLARRVSAKDAEDATTRAEPSLTEAGVVAGTPSYMSPEQLCGREADARSDVWAFGILLYEMLSGRRPFSGQTGFELTSSILTKPPAPLPDTAPPVLKAVVARCLEKEPVRRYQTGGEARVALETSTGSGVVAPPQPEAKPRRRALAFVAGAAVVAVSLFAANVGGLRTKLAGRAAPSGAIKLAVLPFENPGGDAEQEYFSDGLTEEMITELGRLHPERLGVIARASAMRYKKTDKTIPQIAGELGVDYVLEGSARREGKRVRVSAELVRVSDQARLWGESYERELTGILTLQSDLARGVAKSLELKLLPAEEARLVSARAVNAEAYEACLKGLQHVYKMTSADLDAAMSDFQAALDKDPQYALAYSGISSAWMCRSQMGFVSQSEAGPRAREAALKAVELDENLARAHYALAGNTTWYVWDWAAADPEWRRALELNPSDPDTRAFYSHYLNILGRPSEAMPQIEQALKLDPWNPLWQGIYAFDLVFVRRYDEAIAVARKALQAQPDAQVAAAALMHAFLCKGSNEEILALLRAGLSAAGDTELLQAVDAGYAKGGYRTAHERAAQVLIERSMKTFVNPLDIAWAYMLAGDRDPMFEWFEKALAVHDGNMPYLVMPTFDSLRPDPRFQSLLRRMKLKA